MIYKMKLQKSVIIATTTIFIAFTIIVAYITMAQTWVVESNISEVSKLVMNREELKNLKQNNEKQEQEQEHDKEQEQEYSVPIQKVTNLDISSDKFIEDLEKLDGYEHKKITISKDDNGLEEIALKDLIYYFLDYKWKKEDEWYIQDIKNRKYYIPEGIIKIKSGTEFKWDPYKGDDYIDIFLIYKKD